VLGPKATEAQLAVVREQLGVDDPMVTQYVRYLGSIAQGDLGESYSQRAPVLDVIAGRLPYTMLLAAGALTFQLVVGIALGLLSAARAGGVVDRTGLAGPSSSSRCPGSGWGSCSCTCSPTSGRSSRWAGRSCRSGSSCPRSPSDCPVRRGRAG
jgi:hypothetical protein